MPFSLESIWSLWHMKKHENFLSYTGGEMYDECKIFECILNVGCKISYNTEHDEQWSLYNVLLDPVLESPYRFFSLSYVS